MAETFYSGTHFDPTRGSEALNITRKFTLREYGRKYFPHGLQYNVSWIWGHFHEVDTGITYVFTREIKTANSNFFILCQRNEDVTKDDTHLYANPGEVFMGYTSMVQDDQAGTITVEPMYPTDAPFKVVQKEQYINIIDCAGDMNLEYNAVAPGYVMYVPGWLDQDDDIVYCEEPSVITGTFRGKKVEGYGGIDWCYVPAGGDYRHCKLIGGLEKSWPAWANFYKDGTSEGGVFLTGMGDWHLFYHWKRNGDEYGESQIYKRYRYKIDCNTEKSLINHISFELDDVKYEYVTEALGTRATSIANDSFGEIEDVADDTDWIMGHVNTPDSGNKEIKRQYCTNECFVDRCAEFPEDANY